MEKLAAYSLKITVNNNKKKKNSDEEKIRFLCASTYKETKLLEGNLFWVFFFFTFF